MSRPGRVPAAWAARVAAALAAPVASGLVASGLVASGLVASGLVASGLVVSGLVVSALVAAILLPGAGCTRREADAPAPGSSPEACAAALFDAAAGGTGGHGDDEALARLERTLLAERPDDLLRAALGDALEAVRAPGGIEVTGRAPLPDRRVSVEVVARLDGGGEARWLVRCRQDDGGAWRLDGFAGPGADWPPLPAGPDDGLSVSAPPPD